MSASLVPPSALDRLLAMRDVFHLLLGRFVGRRSLRAVALVAHSWLEAVRELVADDALALLAVWRAHLLADLAVTCIDGRLRVRHEPSGSDEAVEPAAAVHDSWVQRRFEHGGLTHKGIFDQLTQPRPVSGRIVPTAAGCHLEVTTVMMLRLRSARTAGGPAWAQDGYPPLPADCSLAHWHAPEGRAQEGRVERRPLSLTAAGVRVLVAPSDETSFELRRHSLATVDVFG